MRQFYIYSLLLFSISLHAQDKENPLRKFDTNTMETRILVPNLPLVNITDYNNKTTKTTDIYQAYKTLAHGDLDLKLAPLENIKKLEKNSYFNNIIPLSIIISEFETITTDALQNNAVSIDHEGFLIRNNPNQNIFEKHRLFMASPLRAHKKGLQTTFELPSQLIINTTNQTIQTIEIDFNDGNGFRTITENQNITIQYQTIGKKTINFRLTLNNGTVFERQSTIEITYSNEDLNTNYNRIITTFTASNAPDLSPYGESTSYPGTGEYELFLSDDNVLDKPIFLVDGFDPEDSRTISGIYDLLNFESNGSTSNLGDLVRAEGFDVVILNFPIYTRSADGAVIDGGVDYIERNAMLLVDLINLINAQKVGDEDNVVIGPSMGGLISRYALNYMENNSMDHETRLWISFDAPHHGANVPIGFQHQFNFLAFGLDDFWILGDQNVEELQPIINGMLKSSAARQMLTDQFEPHITNSDGVTFNSSLSLPRAHPFKTILDSRLNNLTTSGFPEFSRNITIINGSGINSRYPDNSANANDLLPGNQILNADINIMTGADLKVETYFTPNAGSQINSSKVHLDFAWWFPLANDRINNASSTAFTYSNGVDAASGGLFDIGGLTEDLDTDGLVGEFLSALNTDFFNFIPSVSAMAFEITAGEINWFHTPSGIVTNRGTTNMTPFDAWYMPDENEPHVTLTEQNVAFALDEIFQETLSNSNNTFNEIKLEKNPVENQIIVLSNQSFQNALVSITDMTGKIVLNKHMPFNSRTVIPIDLSSGIYVLNVKGEDNYNYKTKFIVN